MLKGERGAEAWIICGLLCFLTFHTRSEEHLPAERKFLEEEEVMDVARKEPNFLLQLLETCKSSRWNSFSKRILSSREHQKSKRQPAPMDSIVYSTQGPTHPPLSTHSLSVTHSIALQHLPRDHSSYSALASSPLVSSLAPHNIHSPIYNHKRHPPHHYTSSKLPPSLMKGKKHHRTRSMAPLSPQSPQINVPHKLSPISSVPLYPLVLAPSSSDPPFSDPSSTPSSAGCCSFNRVPRPRLALKGCSCAYPIKLELIVSNVSIAFANWSAELQQQLSSQLNLSSIQIEITSFHFSESNLSLFISLVPLKNDSFSPEEANVIKSDLESHKLHLNNSLFGNYTIQHFQYIVPPKLPPGFLNVTPALPWLPSSRILPHTNSTISRRNKNLGIGFIIGIVAAALTLFLLLFMSVWKCAGSRCADKKNNGCKERGLSSQGTRKPIDAASYGDSLPWPSATRYFSFEELQEATNNFEPKSLLGEGGSGRVYQGVLKDKTAVAVKMITCGNRQGSKEFLVEVEMLSCLHHRNVVKLVGYHMNRHSSQHLLCYELVPNGNLEDWLHGPAGGNHPLDWDTRMKIALDAARGLAYLHEDSQPCVIHRDFKASNILLEMDFHAKVADFGLAKHAPQDQNDFFSTQVMGTFGYVAPEYAMTGHLLVKSDVYSYGVVLLELLSGKKPVDMSQSAGQENIVTWACPIIRDMERVTELADRRLGGNFPREEFCQVSAMAAACVAPEVSQRPTMGEVVQFLRMIQQSSEYDGPSSTTPTSILNNSLIVSSKNVRQSSTLFESDGYSSMFSSSGPLTTTAVNNETISHMEVFSEDLQEGR